MRTTPSKSECVLLSRSKVVSREVLTLTLALTLTSGANAFAAWENKIYVTLCGGIGEALTIVTVDQVIDHLLDLL